ncbi:hypothetical protein FA13DRAFT_1666819 [Coprinellus micaceus]|uniref:GST N-terminal domain-containing protein n=1 Tax=Coprinellus micaceus TaxID=71717 RepID=A0A4Y7T0V5_COPMI|nr:hypothetical protein FA13DRAFT_1666819 [Coprinellus micaceus]
MITLFDVPASVPGKSWSPNSWKARLSLNYKGIPYKTEWIEYPEIAPVLEKHGIPPSKTKPDGTPGYTVPAILDVDDETGAVKAKVSESFLIAKYLDEAYPGTPKLLPSDKAAEEEQKKLNEELLSYFFPMPVTLCADSLPLLNNGSQDHFTRARAADFYAFHKAEKLEDIPLTPEYRAELWDKAKESFDAFDAKLKDREGKHSGEWYEGGQLTFADFVLGAYLIWILKVWGEESREWKDVKQWNDGRWATIVQRLGPYIIDA